MPELLAVFVVTVLGNIVSGLILDWIHSKHNSNALEGQISFLKIKNPGGTNSLVFFCDEKMSSQLQFFQFKRILAKSNL